MTNRMLRKELVGKKVITEGGTEVGTVEDFVIDVDSGKVVYVLIRGYGKASSLQKTDDKGRLICAFENIKVFEGHLVVR